RAGEHDLAVGAHHVQGMTGASLKGEVVHPGAAADPPPDADRAQQQRDERGGEEEFASHITPLIGASRSRLSASRFTGCAASVNPFLACGLTGAARPR